MKNKKKIAKIIGGIIGIGAICCIIPACVISCGSSSTPTTNNTTGNNLVNLSVTSNNASVTQGSYSSYMNTLNPSEVQQIDSDAGVSNGEVSSEMNQMYDFSQSSTGSTSTYTFSLDQDITGSYKWYSLTSNNSTGTGYEAGGNNSWTQAVAQTIANQGGIFR